MNKKVNDENIFRCEICNKEYASASSLCNHNKKFHKIITTKFHIITQNNTNTPQKSTQKDELICRYCNKKLSRSDSLTRHNNTCKERKIELEKQEKHEQEIKQLKLEFEKKINDIKIEFANIIKEKGHVPPKKLQQINNKVNNINNSYTNINNGNIINNTYVKFGTLDYEQIFSQNDILSILNKQYKALEESITKTHFNLNLPEYSNIFITNMRDNLSYIFNGKEFTCVNKSEVLNTLIQIHTREINLSVEKYKNKLKNNVIIRLKDFIDKLNDTTTKFTDKNTDITYPNYKAYKIQSIRLIIYNESDKTKLNELKNIVLYEKLYDESDSENTNDSFIV